MKSCPSPVTPASATAGTATPLPPCTSSVSPWYHPPHTPHPHHPSHHPHHPPPLGVTLCLHVDTLGVRVVSLPMGALEARAYVEVTELGGMQKQVRCYG